MTDDDTYASVTYKNGSYYETESGTYEIDGMKVSLHPNGNTGHSTPYEYKNGKLVNNGHEFSKD